MDMTIIKPPAWGTDEKASSQSGDGKSNVWVPYARGEELIRTLHMVFDSPPSHRPECRLIYGDSNVGKTNIAIEFAKRINGVSPNPKGRVNAPVLCVETPANASLNLFYGMLLRPFNFPGIPKTLDDKVMIAFDRLPALGVKMIIVDEIHNVLNGKYDKRKEFLAGLKTLTNELRVPIILIGTEPARVAIQVDQQLGNRFVPLHLSGWSVNKEYGAFIQQIFQYWGLDARKLIATKRGLSAIYYHTSGLTGETVSLARELAREIERQRSVNLTREVEPENDPSSNKLEPITLDELQALISTIRWCRPDERRM